MSTLPNLAAKTALCVGHCTMDTIALVDRLPAPDTALELQHFTIQGGGLAATACVTLAKLGVNTRFIGKIGDDDNGHQILRTLSAAGTSTEHVIVQPGVTQFSFTLVERGTGRRNTFWTSGTVPMLTPNDIHPHRVLEGIDLLFVDGHHPEAQTALASAARERGITVVFGASSMTQGARTLVALSDVLIASERFSSQCSGIGRPDDALNALFKLGPSTVVITMGQEGSMGSNGDTIWRQAARHSEAKIDNLGAGDIYRGAFTYAWMSGAGLQECMQIATIAASLSLKGLGPRSDMPTREDLQSALKDGP